MKSKIKKSEKLGRILFFCKKHKNFIFWVATILSIFVRISLTDTFKIYI